LSFSLATRERRSKPSGDAAGRGTKGEASDDTVKLEGPRYIVVEGPIGVGKTSLAKRLAKSFASELILEQAEENPFLERFYRNRRQSALPTQLFFLFQRARQIEQIRQSDMFSPVRIADFLLQKDRLFAEASRRAGFPMSSSSSRNTSSVSVMPMRVFSMISMRRRY
jgi:ATP-dependent protease HslVU (ClpYQ) ATPase subunit